MAYGWEGEKVRLVPLDVGRHLPNAVTWLNDPEVTAWTLIGDLPISCLAEEEYFRRAASETERNLAFAVESLEGEHVGFAGIHDIDHRHGSARTGTIIGRRDLWRRGLGRDAARVRTRYAFEVIGWRLLLSEVMVGNDASVRMLEAVGYRQVGCIPRRYFKRGGYRDALLFALERAASGG
jgi:RimJ/RimL family protein N-acetyltransferase